MSTPSQPAPLTQPTAPGYWWAKRDGEWEPVRVEEIQWGGGAISWNVYRVGSSYKYTVPEYTEWAGPIERESKP